jgi:hypothetical protein
MEFTPGGSALVRRGGSRGILDDSSVGIAVGDSASSVDPADPRSAAKSIALTASSGSLGTDFGGLAMTF